MDKIDPDFFLQLLQKDYTYKDVSKILQENYPGMRGLSEASVKLYCRKHGLSTKISKQELENFVSEAVEEVNVCIRMQYRICRRFSLFNNLIFFYRIV